MKDSLHLWTSMREGRNLWSSPQFFLQSFETSSIDLNNDRREEVIVIIKGVNVWWLYVRSAFTFCKMRVKMSWNMIGLFFSANNIHLSSFNKSGYSDIHFDGKWDSYSCTYKKTKICRVKSQKIISF